MRTSTTILSALAALLFWALIGCSGRTIIMCPEGTIYSNGLCCPVGTFGQGTSCHIPPSDVATDQGSLDIASDGPTLPPPDTTLDQSTTDIDPPDPGTADTPSYPGHIGDPCSNDMDCQNGAVCILNTRYPSAAARVTSSANSSGVAREVQAPTETASRTFCPISL